MHTPVRVSQHSAIDKIQVFGGTQHVRFERVVGAPPTTQKSVCCGHEPSIWRGDHLHSLVDRWPVALYSLASCLGAADPCGRMHGKAQKQEISAED